MDGFWILDFGFWDGCKTGLFYLVMMIVSTVEKNQYCYV